MKTCEPTLSRNGKANALDACPLTEADHVPGCGGKARNLGRMLRLGLPVPPGFVVTDRAFQAFLDDNGLRTPIANLRARADVANPESLRVTAHAVRALVSNAPVPARVRAAVHDLRESILPGKTLIVRSSALGEDGTTASFAGQLDSILNVTTVAGLDDALRACWASYWSERCLFYQLSRGIALQGMGVVIQELVRSQVSGVLFTCNPDPAADAPETLVVEYCLGHGDALVSGRVNPGRVVISRTDLRCQQRTLPERAGEESGIVVAGFSLRRDSSQAKACEYNTANRESIPILSDIRIAELARLGLALEDVFNGPQDIEWTIDADDRLYLVQTRPITALRRVAGVEVLRSPGPAATEASEYLSPGPTSEVWSNANVNENFPEPICPLLYSIAAEGYYHYFRNLGLAFGIATERVKAMEQPLRHLVGVHGARLYYNLTNIHAVLREAPFGPLLAQFFNTFVGATQVPQLLRNSKRVGKKQSGFLRQVVEVAGIGCRATWRFLFLSRSVAEFERTVQAFADRTVPATLDDKPLSELLADLRDFLDIRFNRWTNASLADAAAMLSYGALKHLLGREFPSEDLAALHNTLLKGLSGLVSGEPVARLWELSRAIRSDVRLSQLFAANDSAAAWAAIQNRAEFAGFRGQLDAFLANWGFRCPGELMLTVPSYQETPADLLNVLRAYAVLEGDAPDDVLRRQEQERIADTERVLGMLRTRKLWWWLPGLNRAFFVKRLLRWTHRAIAYRERARLKQALLYSRCRRIALAIGAKLAAKGMLQTPTDVFFLTYGEIDALLAGSAMFPHTVRELVRLRQAAHADLSATQPPDAFDLVAGTYLSPEKGSGSFLSTKRNLTPFSGPLSGVGACGGQATGPAAVLQDVSEFGRLHRGDVLVTRQTDPGWGPVFFLIKGLIMERGGMLSHGAILAREYGIPTVVGVRDATQRIPSGQIVSINGDRGLVQFAP